MELSNKVKKLQELQILFVEDEPDLLNIIENIMSKLSVNYITAIDGKDGLNQFYNHQNIDLIVTDINMENLNGIEMLKEIRKTHPNIPAIIMSAHSEDKYLDEAKQYNIPYLIKPLNFPDFIDIVSKMDFSK